MLSDGEWGMGVQVASVRPRRLTMLFVGAHHDDIELGAGGLVAKAARLGHRVLAVTTTREAEETLARRREQESLAALQSLGVPEASIRFCGLPDGHLQVSRESVGVLRGVLRTLDEPDLVVTHARADCHNDHVATAALVAAAFRGSVILGFAIPNSLLASDFEPRLASPLGGDRDAKAAAVALHRSQAEAGRIDLPRLDRLHAYVGRRFDGRPAEGFDVRVQFDAEDSIAALDGLVGEGALVGAQGSPWSRAGPAGNSFYAPASAEDLARETG